MITRRGFFKWFGRLILAGAATGVYGTVVEAGFRLRTVTYSIVPPRWTPGLKLRVVMLADPHVADPGMTMNRWSRIIESANAMAPDLILFMGDYLATHRFVTNSYSQADVANAVTRAKSRLGSFAICGNHDWWSDKNAQARGLGPTNAQLAFEQAGIPVLENKALRIENNGNPFWLTGTASMVAIKKGRGRFEGRDDLAGTLAQVTDDAPIIHLAHEPDLFTRMPERVSLTLSGHTHGGQIRFFGYSPIVPSQFGNRFAYGHIVEDNRHLIVSGGLGCSGLPIRLGIPPEIVVLELGA